MSEQMIERDPNDPFYVGDKDPNFVYRWCNTDERAMLARRAQGYETVVDEKPEIDSLSGPVAELASGGHIRRRGTDLVLCRISRERFNRSIDAKRVQLRQMHNNAADDAVAETDANAARSLRASGYKPVRGLAFRSSDDSNLAQHARA